MKPVFRELRGVECLLPDAQDFQLHALRIDRVGLHPEDRPQFRDDDRRLHHAQTGLLIFDFGAGHNFAFAFRANSNLFKSFT